LYLFGDLLLLSKKDPEIGYDALVSAAGAGSTKILRKLLDEGIPADSKRPVGATDPVANMFVVSDDDAAPTNELETPMITAPLDSHIEVVRILAQARRNSNAIAAGLSPIIVAARISNRVNFPDLLDIGANPNLPSQATTTLIECVKYGHLDATSFHLSL
jgi:ankyrin repeat protein